MPALPPIDLIYGTMLVGVFLNCILFGIMVMQCFIYYQTYTADRLWLRLFVAYLALAETANTACDMYLVYQPLVQQFGKIEAVTFFPKTLSAAAIVTVLISTPVQLFMGWRISVITGSRKISFLIALFSLVAFAGGVWVTVNVIVLKTFDKKDTFQFNLPGVMWFIASAVTDILITFTLVFTLSRRKTGHSRTTNAVNRIIRLTIQTGLVTMVFALLDLLLFTLNSKTAISFVFDFSVSKLYTNALLSTLNARAGWSNLNNVDEDNVLFGTTANYTSGQISSSVIRKTGTNGGTTLGDRYELKAPKSGDVSISVDTRVHSDQTSSLEEGKGYRKGTL
jgi:hypothetical protein